MSRLDPISLKVFISVVEAGTIAAAAAREHLVPAAVSKRISEIEVALKTQLLVRTNKGVEPTAAGLALSALARKALLELDQIPLQLQGYASGVCGLVRVFASISAMAQFLPGDMKSFLETYPDVQIQVEECSSTAATRAIADNAADVGIYTAAPPNTELETWRYDEDRLVLCVPNGHALAARQDVSLDEVLDEDFVGMGNGTAIGLALQRNAGLRERSLRVRMQAGSFDALCVMIGCGLGVGVMPEAIARRNARELQLRMVSLRESWARRDFWICTRREQASPPAALLLARHLQACARKRERPPATTADLPDRLG